jgi:hypothetical protein
MVADMSSRRCPRDFQAARDLNEESLAVAAPVTSDDPVGQVNRLLTRQDGFAICG